MKNLQSGLVQVEGAHNIVIYNAIELDDVIIGIRKQVIESVSGKINTYYSFPITKKETMKTRESGSYSIPKKYTKFETQLIEMINRG